MISNAGNQDPDLGKYSKMYLKNQAYTLASAAKGCNCFLPLKRE